MACPRPQYHHFRTQSAHPVRLRVVRVGAPGFGFSVSVFDSKDSHCCNRLKAKLWKYESRKNKRGSVAE